jgi:uncharacterized protein involved in exopolysaccharide biosynthesis
MVTLVILSILAPRVYLASVRLQVIAPPPGVITLYGVFRSGGFRDEIAYTQNAFIEILQSTVVTRRALEVNDIPLSVEELQARTEVELESDFIKLTVAGDGPNKAARLANGVATEALSYYGELLARSSEMSKEFISAQRDLALQELDRAQTALMQFKIENKIGSLDDDISQQTNLIRSLNRSRDDAIASGDFTKADSYDVLISQRERELQALLSLGAQYQALQSAVTQASNTYDYLLSKEAEATITENQTSNVSFILVVEPATPPRRSTSSVGASILVLGAVLSLTLGVAVAFVWEYVESSGIRWEEKQGDVPQHQPACVN